MSDEHNTGLREQVRAQLAEWGLDESPEGAAALDIARRLSAPKVADTAAAMLHGQLRALLADLRQMAPPAEQRDEIDDLHAEYEGLRVVGE